MCPQAHLPPPNGVFVPARYYSRRLGHLTVLVSGGNEGDGGGEGAGTAGSVGGGG